MKIAKTYEFEGLEDRLFDEMKKQGLTTNALAEKSGVSASYISQMLEGKTIPLLAKFKKIEEALGVDFGLNL